MTNDKADFTQGSILKKTGRVHDAGSWSINPAGYVWRG